MQTVQEQEAILAKLREEVESLNLRKKGIVNELNEKILVTEAQAKTIISEAKKLGEQIRDEFGKASEEAVRYASKIKGEASDLLLKVKMDREEAQRILKQLDDDRAEFNNYKLATDSEFRSRKAEISSLMEQGRTWASNLAEKESGLKTRESGISRRETELAARESSFQQEEINLSQNKVWFAKEKARIEDLAHGTATLKSELEKMDRDIKARTLQLKESFDRTKALESLCIKVKTEQDAFKIQINSQFAQIEKDQHTLEEKNQSLKERESLLELREKEVDVKFETVKQLRKTK